MMATESQALMDEGHLSFPEVIERSVAIAEALLETLVQERQVLAGVEHDAMAPVFARKGELAAQLSKLDQRRVTLAMQHGDAAATDHPLWSRYCSALEQCREANAINGRLVQDRQRHVRRALGILRGQSDSDPELYSQRGSALPGAQSQDLGRA